MKKIAIIAAICFAFASCAAEAALPQSSAESVTTVEQTAETSASTETAEIMPEETDDISLPGMPLVCANTVAAKSTDYLAGTLDTIISVHDEESYPNKEHIKLARELIFGTKELCEETDVKKIDDIMFDEGVYVDFNGDGIKESVLSFKIYSEEWGAFSPCFSVYVDNSGKAGFLMSWDKFPVEAELDVINYGDFAALVFVTYAGATGMDISVYTFFDGKPKSELGTGKGSLICENGIINALNWYSHLSYNSHQYIFYDSAKKEFVQLGREEITREDFLKHVSGGEEMLEYFLKLKGNKEYSIYTEGYRNFFFEFPEKDKDGGDATAYFRMELNADGSLMDVAPRHSQDCLLEQDIYVINKENIVYGVDYYGLTATNTIGEYLTDEVYLPKYFREENEVRYVKAKRSEITELDFSDIDTNDYQWDQIFSSLDALKTVKNIEINSIYVDNLDDIPKLESLEITDGNYLPDYSPTGVARVICSIPTLKTLRIKGSAKELILEIEKYEHDFEIITE